MVRVGCPPFYSVQEVAWSAKDDINGRNGFMSSAQQVGCDSGRRTCLIFYYRSLAYDTGLKRLGVHSIFALSPSCNSPTEPITHHEYSSEKYSIFDIALRDSYENLRIHLRRPQKGGDRLPEKARHNILLACRQIYEEPLHF